MRRPFEAPRRSGGRARAILIAAGVAAVQAALLVMSGWRAPPPPGPSPPLIEVRLESRVRAPDPVTEPAPEGDVRAASEPAPAVEATAPMPRPEPPRPTPRRIVRTPPPESPVPAVAPGPVGPPDLPILGGAQLAGALRAGGGPGGAGSGQGGGGPGGRGGDCDMVARLERALSADADIRAAVAASLAGRGGASDAVLVWDGDWLQSPGEAGKGLAGVRQAIAVEVGFAPRACREELVRGTVVLAAAADPGAPRLALRAGTWRWRDLLGL